MATVSGSDRLRSPTKFEKSLRGACIAGSSPLCSTHLLLDLEDKGRHWEISFQLWVLLRDQRRTISQSEVRQCASRPPLPHNCISFNSSQFAVCAMNPVSPKHRARHLTQTTSQASTPRPRELKCDSLASDILTNPPKPDLHRLNLD